MWKVVASAAAFFFLKMNICMRENLPLPFGTAFKKHINQLIEADIPEVELFFKCIRSYNAMVANHYKVIKESEARYLSLLFTIRLMIDAIYSLYALKLVPNKMAYINKFINNEETNKIKVNGRNLTTTYIGEEISKEYNLIDELYKESCRYLHPSVFFKMSKKIIVGETKGILTKRNIWKVRGINNQYKLEYIVEALTNIMYDIELDIHNNILVPLYPDKLTPIRWKRRATQISMYGCKDYIRSKNNARDINTY